MLRTAILAVSLLALALIRPLAAQASQTETLTGLVKGDSGVAIPNATITVTPAGGGFSVAVTVRSNAGGKWTALMPNRAPEYYVTVSAIGWVQQRTTAKSLGGTTPVVVDVTMKKAAVQLGPVRVIGQKRQPPPREVIGADVAATEKGVLASAEVFAVADQGDLMGMIASVPGITVTSDASTGLPSFSVLGLSGAQNNVTLNGLAFGGGDVPRDIIGAMRVSSSTYDVSRGGFSGAQLSVTQVPGGNFVNQIAHATLDAPTFQATDAIGWRLGQQYTNAILSGGFSGPFVFDRLFYNVSFQGGRRRHPGEPSRLVRALVLDGRHSVGRQHRLPRARRPVARHGSHQRDVRPAARRELPWQLARVQPGRRQRAARAHRPCAS